MVIKIRVHHLQYLFDVSQKYYSPEMKQKVSGLRRKLLDDLNIKIKITQHKDHICKEICPYYQKRCNGRGLKDWDKYFAKPLNLRIGKIYLVYDLINRLSIV